MKERSTKLIKPSEDGIDRISNLPDHLISKILSLLSIENAVATSALSRRWKFLWTSVTTLNLAGERPQKRVNKNKTKFLVFVNRVIMFITPPRIHKFHFISSHRFLDPIHLEMWVSVIAQTVRELDLDLQGNLFELEMNHFRMNKLVTLMLSGDINFIIPSQASVCFPNLQTLHLCGIRFEIATDSSVSFPNLMILHFYGTICTNEESFHKLFSSCPVLQEIYVSYLSRLTICTPSLTTLQLVVLNLVGSDINFKIAPKAFVCFPHLQQLHLSYMAFSIPNDASVSFPNLKILHFDCSVGNYTDGESVQKLISSCPVLQNLSIRINNWKDLPCLIIAIPSLTKLQFACWLSTAFEVQIDDLHKLQFLSISGDTLKVFWTAFANNNISSGFYNLKRLELEVDDCSKLLFVINNVLESMDNLNHLAIWLNYGSCSCANRSWSEPLDVPKGLAWRVTTISFDQPSENCHYKLEFLRYILKNARVLQVLKVDTGWFYSSEKRKQLVKKVSKFPKESQACQVKFI